MNGRTNAPALKHMPTRRRVGAYIAMAFCSMASNGRTFVQAAPQTMEEKPANPANRTRTSLHDEITLKTDPQHIYEVLLSAKQFKAFTGAPAEIDPAPVEPFPCSQDRSLAETLSWSQTSGSCKRGDPSIGTRAFTRLLSLNSNNKGLERWWF